MQTTVLEELTSNRPDRVRRVLFVTYTFPPIGGAGVQRVTKFVKYVGRFGWEPTVLTVANPSVPVLDESLLADIPAGTAIHEARSWEPGYGMKAAVSSSGPGAGSSRVGLKQRVMRLAKRAAATVLQPDPQILWYPSAVRVGKRLLAEQSFDAIFATAPPFTSFLVGRTLARLARLPLIVDYRDEWTMARNYQENKGDNWAVRTIQRRMERRVLRAASAVLATTERSAAALREGCEEAKSSATVACIYNGFDPDDFCHHEALAADSSRLRLVYTGTLWNLTSVHPLVEGVRKLSLDQPKLAERLELVFAGRRVGEQNAHIEVLQSLPCKVVIHDYLDHHAAIGLLHSADANCLLLSDVPGAERVVPAKLFEYIASRRPILALLPRGEAWELLTRYSDSQAFLPADNKGLVEWLAHAIQNKLSRGPQSLASDPPRDFDRQYQAGQLAEVLNSCCAGSRQRAL